MSRSVAVNDPWTNPNPRLEMSIWLITWISPSSFLIKRLSRVQMRDEWAIKRTFDQSIFVTTSIISTI